MSWTDERIAKLRKLWDDGLSASQIAQKLGNVTRNAVIGKAHRLGLKARPSPVKQETPPPKAAPKKPKSAAKPAKVTLLDLNERMCKWPIGHPGEADFHFCGKKAEAGFPYCSAHCAEAYQSQQVRRDRRPSPG
ncbi:MAG: global cell cycle regulator GcrA-like protein, partial [Alphaproteobacteria bacterium]